MSIGSAAGSNIIDIQSASTASFEHNLLERTHRARRADLSSVALELQKFIEIDKVLQIFNMEVNARIPWCSIAYDNEEIAMHSQFGKASAFACSYRLVIEGSSLGDIRFSKIDKFSKREISLLEDLLCVLIYPLRNAIKYYRAIRSASTDPLTKLGNRHAYEQALEREISIADRHHSDLSLLVIDIDFFKNINDRLGHAAGDQVLKQVGHLLNLITRGSDQAFRYGGEEFIVLLSNTDVNGAALFAERLRIAIEALDYSEVDGMLKTTVSIGVAEYESSDDAISLFKRADLALYQAKQTGRNRVVK